jgi:hypothetical protein
VEAKKETDRVEEEQGRARREVENETSRVQKELRQARGEIEKETAQVQKEQDRARWGDCSRAGSSGHFGTVPFRIWFGG